VRGTRLSWTSQKIRRSGSQWLDDDLETQLLKTADEPTLNGLLVALVKVGSTPFNTVSAIAQSENFIEPALRNPKRKLVRSLYRSSLHQ
jgi:hypothetical protein